MHNHGDILLVSCYELGHPSFGVALLAGFLEKAGFSADTIDISVVPISKEKLLRAKLLGISVPMHTALRIGVKVAEQARKINPTCQIAFFGLYASLNADFLLKHLANFIIGEEEEMPLRGQRALRGEEAFVKIVQALSDSDPNDKAHPQRPNEAAHLAGARCPPSRTTLPPLSKYAHLEKDGTRYLAGYVEASRGCRHLCRHCPIPPVYGGRFTIIPEEILVEDIAAQVALGAEHITFGDPDFLNGPNHSLKIVRQMHERFPALTFDFTAKIEHLLQYQNLIPEFVALGCIFIISAVESLCHAVLRHLDKGHTRTDVIKAIKIVHENGIALRPSLVPFTPWESLDSYIDLFDFAEHYQMIHHIDPVQYTVRLLIPPGSLLLSEPAMIPYLGPLVQESFTYQWKHPDSRMDVLQKQVSHEVEQMTASNANSEDIFYQLKATAIAMAEGRSMVNLSLPPTGTKPVKRDHGLPPRMTESWFCCSEPTENQIALLDQTLV